MMCPAAVLWATLLLAGGENQPPKLLVLPIIGLAPREMNLPGAEEMAQAIMLQCSTNELRIVVEQPTFKVDPNETESIFSARARQIEAAAVVWGELVEPADCPAPRRIRLRLMEVASGLVVERLLCPAQASASEIARTVGLAVVTALRSGELVSVVFRPRQKKTISRKDFANTCPPPSCPPCPDCSPCEPPQVPPPSSLPYPRAPHFVEVAVGFSTHPRLQDPSLQLGAGVFLSLADFFEIGLEASAQRPTSLSASKVSAVYQAWPFALSSRLHWGKRWQMLVAGQFLLVVNRLDALLEEIPDSVSIGRWDPALALCAGVRWWPKPSLALQLGACSEFWLRVQVYNYLYLGLPLEVLRLDRISATAQIFLIVPWGGD